MQNHEDRGGEWYLSDTESDTEDDLCLPSQNNSFAIPQPERSRKRTSRHRTYSTASFSSNQPYSAFPYPGNVGESDTINRVSGLRTDRQLNANQRRYSTSTLTGQSATGSFNQTQSDAQLALKRSRDDRGDGPSKHRSYSSIVWLHTNRSRQPWDPRQSPSHVAVEYSNAGARLCLVPQTPGC
jgi:hypothetical protein